MDRTHSHLALVLSTCGLLTRDRLRQDENSAAPVTDLTSQEAEGFDLFRGTILILLKSVFHSGQMTSCSGEHLLTGKDLPH